MLAHITANIVPIGQGFLMILGGFSILAKITPTEVDNRIIDKILTVIHTLGLTK